MFGWTLLAAALIVGCGPSRLEQSQEAARSETAVGSARSSRGNPPFYDVLGRRYYVRPSSLGYQEVGIASWYGPKFHGRPTSNGEIYDMYAMTAAHTTLPIPTWVEVTNLANNRRVIVRVNDRGPFLHDRIIDLSYTAAMQLDMVQEGTARVEVRALDAFSDAQANYMSENVYIQVGAFSVKENAEDFALALKSKGFSRAFVDSNEGGSSRLHRVLIGPYERTEKIDTVFDDLTSAGLGGAYMVIGH
ncbi:MAG: septal ring lytic transglycosylase RlpA family lipoprotein [Rhodospirillaceae bacterium]|nr:septal ring lytic transglycosylase RlpA family lipoprotein [Rhodospirillaceae bacterium]|tara:strand:- start:271 stop:1011 length:741 start_codon:yes stop_codon:yes gene_type:complete